MADSFNNWTPGSGSFSGFTSPAGSDAFRNYAPNAQSYSGFIAGFTPIDENTPGAPTSVAAVAGNAIAVITWTAPVSTGGAPITKYTVTSSPATTQQVLASGGTFTGLTNGTAYTFTVVATNAAGDGPASSPSASITVGTPAAPTGVTATAGNASAVVTWTDGSNNGSAVTSYDIVSIPATTTQHGSSGLTFTGLTNGTAYTFKVTANNARGSGVQSAASNSVTPAAPGPPNPSTNWAATLNDPTYTQPGSLYASPGVAPTFTGGGFSDPLGGTKASQIVWSASTSPNANMLYGFTGWTGGASTMVNGSTYVIKVQVYSTVAFDMDCSLMNYSGNFSTFNSHVSFTHTGSGWETLGATFVANSSDAGSPVTLAFGSLLSAGRQLSIPATTTRWYDWEIGPV